MRRRCAAAAVTGAFCPGGQARCQSSAGYGASSLLKAYIEQGGPNWFVPVQLIGAYEAGTIEKGRRRMLRHWTRSRSNRERPRVDLMLVELGQRDI